jgi:hypothetical protein
MLRFFTFVLTQLENKKMIEINNISYSSNKIILHKKLREKVKFGSSSNIVTFILTQKPLLNHPIPKRCYDLHVKF